MSELMKCLDRAFLHLSKIPFVGDSVDFMALARQELRAAYALVEKRNAEKADTTQESEVPK